MVTRRDLSSISVEEWATLVALHLDGADDEERSAPGWVLETHALPHVDDDDGGEGRSLEWRSALTTQERRDEKQLVLDAFRASEAHDEAGETGRSFAASVRWWWIGGIVAAAMLLTWVVPEIWPSRPSAGNKGLFIDYEPEWSRGYVGSMRGGTVSSNGCDQTLRVTDPLMLRLRPQRANADKIELATYATQLGGESRWLSLGPEINDLGVISIDSNVGDQGLTVGRWTLTFFIAGTDVASSDRELAALVDAGPGRHVGFTAVATTVCVVD